MKEAAKALRPDRVADSGQPKSTLKPGAMAGHPGDASDLLVRPRGGWLTDGQAAKHLGLSVSSVRDWINRGTLTGQRLGSRWRVSGESVNKVLGLRRVLADMDLEGYPPEGTPC